MRSCLGSRRWWRFILQAAAGKETAAQSAIRAQLFHFQCVAAIFADWAKGRQPAVFRALCRDLAELNHDPVAGAGPAPSGCPRALWARREVSQHQGASCSHLNLIASMPV